MWGIVSTSTSASLGVDGAGVTAGVTASVTVGVGTHNADAGKAFCFGTGVDSGNDLIDIEQLLLVSTGTDPIDFDFEEL
jgi:hypothetical protein